MVDTLPTKSHPNATWNPTNEVGGWFILSLLRATKRDSESHQRSWWMIHTQPTKSHQTRLGIPPTKLVDGSYSAY
jgi:hypothetical protein